MRLLTAAILSAALTASASAAASEAATLAPTDLNRVAIGTEAPDFSLTRADGERVTLSSFRGHRNVVLVFYRGTW